MASELPLYARVFGAIIRALEAEGFRENEAYYLARRGAELLTDFAVGSIPDHSGKTFRALLNAFLAEGVDPLEACRMAERGAQLLLALEALPDDRWERLRDCVARIRAGSE